MHIVNCTSCLCMAVRGVAILSLYLMVIVFLSNCSLYNDDYDDDGEGIIKLFLYNDDGDDDDGLIKLFLYN